MLTPLFWKRVGLSFVRAFIPVFILGVIPLWDQIVAGDWDAGKSALIALISGAVTAGIRAAQIFFTTVETDPRLKPPA